MKDNKNSPNKVILKEGKLLLLPERMQALFSSRQGYFVQRFWFISLVISEISPEIMNKKNEYRIRVLSYFCILAIITFTILFLTTPKLKTGPQIRVLHIFYSDQSAFITVISDKQNTSVIINRDELHLESEEKSFYKNNLVLECTSSYPISFQYEGYGTPNVDVHNFRKFLDYNDTATYYFTSSINLMPISEQSSGRYTCSGVSHEYQQGSSFVNLFVPGEQIFTLAQDITIESDVTKELFIPCPVTDPQSTFPGLITKGEKVDEKFVKSYDPSKGFVLNAKFLEEKDPLSTYFCQDPVSKQKSGRITIIAKKDSMVLVNPKNSSVTYSNSFNGTFSCQAEENVTLKFRKIQKFKKVGYFMSLDNFPYQAIVNFDQRDLIEGSVISCVTVNFGTILHSWTVTFLESEEMETPRFFYKGESDQYICCGTPANRPKMTKISCNHPIECNIRENCHNAEESDKCRGDAIKIVERSSCLHYKVDYKQNISSGQLMCSVGEESEEHYNYANIKTSNGTIISNFNSRMNPTQWNISDNLIEIETMFIKQFSTGTMQKYRCKGPKFYFAGGFMWQIVRYNGLIDFYEGRDYFEGPWVYSEVQFQNPFKDLRQGRRIYCIAPIWGSETGIVYKFANISNANNNDSKVV